MILITGASGSTGSYLLESLLAETRMPIIAWVRQPERLKIRSHPRLHIWTGGLEAFETYRPALNQVSHLIHTATCWGGLETFQINVKQSWRLIQSLDPQICRQIHLFSTASLLGPDQRFIPQSLQWGTDYIRSKATLHQRLVSAQHQGQLQIPVSIYYPTVVLGGDHQHPYTAAAAGLNDLPRWLKYIRWLNADGRFHLIHARDIARIVTYRLIHNLPAESIVLGNPAIEINELIQRLLKLHQIPAAPFRLPLKPALPALTAAIYPLMSNWDRYSLRARHLSYNSIHAASYQLPTDLATPEAMIKAVTQQI